VGERGGQICGCQRKEEVEISGELYKNREISPWKYLVKKFSTNIHQVAATSA
jgi:hypothetical protein